MTEKIEIKNSKVQCPKGGKVQESTCKHCDHCRIVLANIVKCSYEQDMKRKSQTISSYYH